MKKPGAVFLRNVYLRSHDLYRHHSSIVLRKGDGTANIIHSREGGIQIDPLDMVAYRIGILPLTKRLKLTYPGVTQICYADDSGALGTFYHMEKYFKALNCNGLAWGYSTEPNKSILGMHP